VIYLKTDIKKVGFWWKWNEYCNNCGKKIRDFDEYSSSSEPDENKEDYCSDCMRKKLNGGS